MKNECVKNLKKDDSAVSPVIGVILIFAITVILAAVIAAFVFGIIWAPLPNNEVQPIHKISIFVVDKWVDESSSYPFKVLDEYGNRHHLKNYLEYDKIPYHHNMTCEQEPYSFVQRGGLYNCTKVGP